jgi:DNA invertase Pin-like site-specific DNA recombinase
MARSRTMEVMAAKRERNEHLGGQPPYGFRVEDGKLVPDEAEREAMEYARSLRKNLGTSLQGIADALTEEGVPRRNGRPWTRQAIGRLLE